MSILKKKDDDNSFSVTCPKCGSDKVTTAGPASFSTGVGNAGINMKNAVVSQNYMMYICGNCGNNFKPDN